MADATMKDFAELAGAVNEGEFPILPRPHWGQDAAFIAFVLDDAVATNKRLFQALLDAGVPQQTVEMIARG